MLLAKGHSPLERAGLNRLDTTGQRTVAGTPIHWECYLDSPPSIKKK